MLFEFLISQLASNTAPVNEVINDKNNGLLTSFFNPKDIADKIDYALENQTKADKIRENARKSVLEKYELGNCLENQIKLIIQLIQKFSEKQTVNS